MAYDSVMDGEEDNTDENSPVGNLANALTSNYTTADAKAEAKTFIEDYRKGSNSTESKDLMARMDDQAKQARQVLAEARQRLLDRQYSRNLKLMAWSSGLTSNSPGNFAGELGNANRALLPYEEKSQQFDMDKDAQRLNIEQAMVGTGDSALKAQQQLEMLRRKNEASLANQSLKVLGKEIRPGANKPASLFGGSFGPFEKMARGEGFQPDTPEFNAEVRRLVALDTSNKRANSGLDIDEEDTQQTAHIADQLGVPSSAPDPYKGLGSKQRQKQIEVDRKMAQAELDKLNPSVEINNQAIQMAQRVAQLNEKINTSSSLGVAKNLSIPLSVWGMHGDPGKALGQLVYGASGLSSAATEMDKLQNDLARAKRLPGERFTNYDQQMLQSTVPGRDKPYLTNKNLTTAIIQAKQLTNDHVDFLNNYFQTHGHLKGAEVYWNQYLTDNPIFDAQNSKIPTSKVGNNGSYVLNKSRQDYKTYFRTHNKSNLVNKGPIATPGASSGTGFYKNEAESGYADGGAVDTSMVQKSSYPMGLGSEALQGATLGMSDELMGEPSHDRARLESFSDENPLSASAAQFAGAGASALAAKAALKKLAGTHGKVGQAAGVLLALAERYPFASRTLLGGTAGTVAGAASGDENTGSLNPALTGGAVGLMLSPFGSLAAKYALKGGRRLLPGGSSVPNAEQSVIRSLQQNQTPLTSLPSIFSRDAKANVPSMVGDLGGQPLETLTQGALRHPGPETQVLADAIQNRQLGARGRVSDVVNKALKPDDYFTQEDKLTNQLYENSRPLYEKAYQEAPDIQSKAFDQLAQTDEGQAAIKYARKRMQLDLSKSGVTSSANPVEQINRAKTQEDLDRISHSLGLFQGDPTVDSGKLEDLYTSLREKLPSSGEVTTAPTGRSLEFLDYVKKGMDSQINKAYRSGDNNMARLLQDHRNALRDDLDIASGSYKEARGQYAGDLEVKNALKMGREDFDSMAPQELAKATSDMSFSEKDALRSGVAQRLFEKISNPSSDVNYARKIVGSPATMDKLQTIFDKPSEFKAFSSALDREADLYDSSAKALSAAKKGSGALTIPHPGSILSSVWRHVSRPGGMGDATANNIAKILSMNDPNEIKALVTQLTASSKKMASRESAESAAKLAGSVGAGAVTMSNPRGYTDNQEQP